jgi:hypothetical protein
MWKAIMKANNVKASEKHICNNQWKAAKSAIIVMANGAHTGQYESQPIA